MTPFKTQQEILKHLVAGGKVKGAISNIVLGFLDGTLYNFSDNHCMPLAAITTSEDWLQYHEPLKLEFEARVQYQDYDESDDMTFLAMEFKAQLKKDIENKRFKVTMTEIVGYG